MLGLVLAMLCTGLAIVYVCVNEVHYAIQAWNVDVDSVDAPKFDRFSKVQQQLLLADSSTNAILIPCAPHFCTAQITDLVASLCQPSPVNAQVLCSTVVGIIHDAIFVSTVACAEDVAGLLGKLVILFPLSHLCVLHAVPVVRLQILHVSAVDSVPFRIICAHVLVIQHPQVGFLKVFQVRAVDLARPLWSKQRSRDIGEDVSANLMSHAEPCFLT
mmetsp:Transcript_98391/g.175197  ORF Transcript_98391/g.175197 Transcript_98391/m.175197 type:complete len:216 (+) Transcript_98391:100-747(+)